VPCFPAVCGGLLVRYAGDGLLYLLLGVLEVHELARQVLLVGGKVEVPVSAEVEEYGPPLGLRARMSMAALMACATSGEALLFPFYLQI
jgi:hypothetical protein